MVRARTVLTGVTANIGSRSAPNHDTLLHAANKAKIGIVMVQEPFVTVKDGKLITKHHPKYKTYIPTTGQDLQPNVITYVRRDPGLRAEQLHPAKSHTAL